MAITVVEKWEHLEGRGNPFVPTPSIKLSLNHVPASKSPIIVIKGLSELNSSPMQTPWILRKMSDLKKLGYVNSLLLLPSEKAAVPNSPFPHYFLPPFHILIFPWFNLTFPSSNHICPPFQLYLFISFIPFSHRVPLFSFLHYIIITILWGGQSIERDWPTQDNVHLRSYWCYFCTCQFSHILWEAELSFT